MTIRRRGVETRLIIEGNRAHAPRADSALLKAVARARRRSEAADGQSAISCRESYLKEWTARAGNLMNPLLPAPDLSKTTVRFLTGFPGRSEHSTHKSIGAYFAGEIAGFDRAQAALLFELGVAEPFTAPPPEEEPGEAA
jgi:hypothetical protein